MKMTKFFHFKSVRLLVVKGKIVVNDSITMIRKIKAK